MDFSKSPDIDEVCEWLEIKKLRDRVFGEYQIFPKHTPPDDRYQISSSFL